MTDVKKIFIDTAPFIYLMEGHERFVVKIEKIVNDCIENNIQIATSVITYTEFCVKPYELNEVNIIKAFNDLIKELNIKVYDINIEIADVASRFRAKYNFLKGMDSIQIATAIFSNSDIFITNDKKLKRIPEIKVMLVDEWK